MSSPYILAHLLMQNKRTQYLNAQNTIAELLDMGVIPIVNENDTIAVTEIKFGDNDTLSAITAAMVHADYLFLMTDVDCLYDKNPRTHPDAKAIEVVEDISMLAADGTLAAPPSPNTILTNPSIKRRLSSRHRRHVHQDRRRPTRHLCRRNNSNNSLLQPRQHSQYCHLHPISQNPRSLHHVPAIISQARILREDLFRHNISRRAHIPRHSIPETRACPGSSTTHTIRPLASTDPRSVFLALAWPRSARNSLHRCRSSPRARKQSRSPPRRRRRRRRYIRATRSCAPRRR